MEGDGSGENNLGFSVEWLRRALDATDEVQAMLADNTSVTNEYRVRAFVDPSGANTEVHTTAWATGAALAAILTRQQFIDVAAAGTEIRIQVETRLAGGGLTSRSQLIHDVTPTSVNDGLFYLGGQIAAAAASNAFTVASAGVHTIATGTAHSTTVQHRVNGGSWISALTTASLSISDTIEVRTISSGTPDGNFVEIINPSAARVAYGTFSS